MLYLHLDDEYKWYQSPKQNDDDNYLHFMSFQQGQHLHYKASLLESSSKKGYLRYIKINMID